MGTSLEDLVGSFADAFGGLEGRVALAVRAPGRSELAGNHTDHEGGHVIAATVDRAVAGLFSPNGTGELRVVSEGFDPVAVSLDELAPRADERGATSALVRGIAATFVEAGYAPDGYDAVVASDVAAGSGLSSSAAFELALAAAGNALWAKGGLSATRLAVMSQTTERTWFGKPCGLMDQASVALGGIQHLSFAMPGVVNATALDFSLASAGYTLCLVNVGADHSANTGDYAAVPAEMQAVAAALGKGLLGELAEGDVIANIPRLRVELGDRAVLRALHYFREERLVGRRAAALSAGDMAAFLALTRLSGASSAMYLQNVGTGDRGAQPAMLALALADELLGDDGACRIHGGGFGGTIQAFVPTGDVDRFSAGMDAAFGDGACAAYGIEPEGVRARWL